MRGPTAGGRVVVLGAGGVGRVVAGELAAEEGTAVRVVDASSRALERAAAAGGVETLEADLADPREIAGAVEDADLVVGALPGPMGFDTLVRLVELRRDVVDVSFLEEDPFELDGAARGAGVTVVVDAGLAPGLSNLLLGRAEASLDETRRFECLVGGLPDGAAARDAPFGYRAPFSPVDVLAEYTRPARIRRGGEPVVRPALSGVEEVDFPGVGRLEAFLTDGLRTLLATSDVPELVEKTLRYPGHAAAMRGLRDAGFLSADPVEVAGLRVRPLDLAVGLLGEAWRFREGDRDLTVMRVTVEGRRGERDERHVWELLDRYDPETGTLSMARTTGFTCAALARLVLAGEVEGPGIVPPERIGADAGAFESVVAYLRGRGVSLTVTVDEG